MTSIIVKEFKLLVDKALSDKDKGWQFKVKNYNKVINILNINTDSILNTIDVLEILRNGGMNLPNEHPPNWKSKIMIKIDTIINEGTLGTILDEKTLIIKELTKIPGIGPSKANTLFKQGIFTIEQLNNRLDLINEKQKIGLRHYKDLEQKIPRDEMDIWDISLSELSKEVLGNNLVKVCLAGSFRRGLQESGDIDCYLCVKQLKNNTLLKIYNTLINEGYITKENVFSKGCNKIMTVARLPFLENSINRHLDIFIYPIEQYPFAILYATGSGQFNIKMRNRAIKLGYSLSDKGIKVASNKGDIIKKDLIHSKIGKNIISTEKDIFQFLEMEYIEPKLRTPTVKIIYNSSS